MERSGNQVLWGMVKIYLYVYLTEVTIVVRYSVNQISKGLTHKEEGEDILSSKSFV